MSFLHTLWITVKLIPLPFVVLWKVLTTTHASYNKTRSLQRICADATFRYNLSTFTIPELRATLGSSLKVYTKWAKEANVPSVVDELGEDARLLWIGPKRLDRVILVAHGGAFALPALPPYFTFWHYVRLEMERQGVECGIAMLSYSLWPEASFPQPLNQLRMAVAFLLSAGLQPHRLQLAGDSAGGNLTMQLLSHILHPHPNVPPLTLVEPISAVHLLSPWVGLVGETASWDENASIDCTSKEWLVRIGREILSKGFGEDDTYRAFAEACKADPTWFHGIEQLVSGSIVITAGDKECLRDDVLKFGEILERHHPKVEVVVQPRGLHDDMFLDAGIGKPEVGVLTPLIIDRLLSGFK
ncbi:Alpha/Beta hydrolase protein [Roridomyces roridus]|uniref:Alpha/Beta hydrolase protein n=1 Tax=Roridomyces roridus TaxID=1738132 RepID=A0AAD7BLP7_9AGAR|nr:Alpha/Beta hydrolase protein [Roridomyces roridus]